MILGGVGRGKTILSVRDLHGACAEVGVPEQREQVHEELGSSIE